MNRISAFYKQNRGKLWIAQAVGLLIIGLLFGLSLRGDSTPSDANGEDGHAAHNVPEKVAEIWTCSMHPQISPYNMHCNNPSSGRVTING